MAKAASYRCNCGVEFVSKSAMVSHYRREHPSDGWSCWDQIGDLGDGFANSAMNHLFDKCKELTENNRRLQNVEQQYNALLRKLITIQEILR